MLLYIYKIEGEAGGHMKNLILKLPIRACGFFFACLAVFCLIPTSPGEAVEAGTKVLQPDFQPGAMVLLGISLIWIAVAGRNRYRKPQNN